MADASLKAVLEIGATIDRGSLSAAFDKIKKEQGKLGDVIEDNKLEQKALNAQMKGLSKASPELQRLRAQYDEVGNAIKRDEVALVELIREQRRLAKTPITPEGGPSRLAGLGAGVRKLGGGMASLTKGAAVAGTAIAGAAIGGIAAMDHMAEGMAQTARNARSLGISAESLQELRHAARKSGLEVQDLDNAMVSLNVNISEGMAEGTGPAVEAFETLGLKIGDIYKMKPEKRFEAITKAMEEIQPSDRLQLLALLTDEETSKGLATMMEGGVEGLRAMRQEARDMGLIISTENLEAAEQFNQDLGTLKTAAFAALAPIAAELMPKVVEGLREGVQWIRDNHDAIATFGARVGEVATVVAGWTIKGFEMVGALSEMQGGFANVLETATLLFGALKVGLLSNPFTAALFGIGMAVKAVYDNWDDLVIIWRDFVQPGIDSLIADFKVFGDMLSNLIPSMDTFKGAWDTVVSALPFTEAAGTAAPTPRANAGGGSSVVTNNFHIAADLSEESVRRSHMQAAEDAARAQAQSAGYSMPSPGAV